jgi:hypothetical protein
VLEDVRVALELTMRHGGSDAEPAFLGRDAAELVDSLDVDQMREFGEPELEQEQQLGPACVYDRLVAQLVE